MFRTAAYLMLISLSFAQALRADDREPTPQAKAEAEIRKLLREYTAARRDRARQAEVVERAAEHGAAASQRLQPLVAKELFAELNRYGAAYRRAAGKLAFGRLSQTNPAEVALLREQFRAIRQGANFTKEKIKSKGDPIIERLESLLVISRDQVLESSPPLAEQRAKLQEVGRLWERLAAVGFEAMQESITDPLVREQLTKPSFESFLLGEEEIETRMTIPMSPRDRAVLTSNARIAKQLDRSEARAVLAANLLRILVGQSPCALDVRLAAAARDHSNDMKTLKFFSHTSKVPAKRDFTTRAKNFRTTASGENIAIHGGGGSAVVRAWFVSPGHHKNMFGSHKRIGVGKSGRYWTQMFGR